MRVDACWKRLIVKDQEQQEHWEKSIADNEELRQDIKRRTSSDPTLKPVYANNCREMMKSFTHPDCTDILSARVGPSAGPTASAAG